ncbi:hypothetical protein [Methanosarcina barkeri]|uniref:hypothetical protein n=1 Tax=Methanosarcina barkeri TaxID=2208 RepID=UPI000B0946AA|nr:hypothetical protein [Methanosarcina barkeri]
MFTDLAEIIDSNNRLIGKGMGTNRSIKINWSSLLEFKKKATEECPGRIESYFVEMGINTYHGKTYFENQTQ